MFHTFPPTIQEYLPVDDDVVPFLDEDRNIYNYPFQLENCQVRKDLIVLMTKILDPQDQRVKTNLSFIGVLKSIFLLI